MYYNSEDRGRFSVFSTHFTFLFKRKKTENRPLSSLSSLIFLLTVYHLGIHIADFIAFTESYNLTLCENERLVAELANSVGAV